MGGKKKDGKERGINHSSAKGKATVKVKPRVFYTSQLTHHHLHNLWALGKWYCILLRGGNGPWPY